MLDEPLSTFDIVVSHDIKELLIKMKHDHIVIMSTHILQLATDVSDEIVLLHNGKLSALDSGNLNDELLEEAVISALKDGE